MSYQLSQFTPRGDSQGWLIALEEGLQVPFPIKRVYYIYGTKSSVKRGKHAHKKLRQLAICLKGSCRFFMDDGKSQKEFTLDRNTQGLVIEPMVWHEMDDFSEDCILLVLASDLYAESDYIRSRAEFDLVVGGQRS
jgi:dTDP-4-dehydrorhamnose 3,5-epimerase-like enzyme